MAFSITSEKTTERYGGIGTQNVFGIFTTALSLLQNGRLVVPLLLYFALRFAIIFLYLVSVNEPLSSFWASLIGGFSGEDVSHYPTHLILMPAILGRFDIALDILVSVLFLGATITLVAAAYRRKPVSIAAGFSGAARCYRRMVMVMLLISIALFICLNLPRFLATNQGGMFRIGITALSLVLGISVQALFLYAIPSVVLEHRSALKAIAASVRSASRSAFTTFLLVALPFILTVPTLLLGFKAEMIAFLISPDFLLINQVMSEIMHLIATYLIIAGATIVLIRQAGGVRHGT